MKTIEFTAEDQTQAQDTFNVRTHNGYITVTNPATGGHRTFKVRTQPEDSNFAPGKRVVYLLTGPDREDWKAWKSFGFVFESGVKLWKKLQAEGPWATYANMLNHPEQYPTCEYLYEGHCRRCNRSLSHPESIKSGIGPYCASKA